MIAHNKPLRIEAGLKAGAGEVASVEGASVEGALVAAGGVVVFWAKADTVPAASKVKARRPALLVIVGCMLLYSD